VAIKKETIIMALTNDQFDDEKSSQFEQPTEAEKELTSWVTQHITRWRDHRDANYMDLWQEYERVFRGIWAAEDKTRESERSRIISPATQQAIETRHAEIMEAIFGQGEFFDIQDDVLDVDGNPLDVEQIKVQLHEDFKRDKIKKAIDQIELMAEIYGTGIGEIIVKTEKQYVPATQAIPGIANAAAIGVQEKDRIAVKIKPVNPKNFLIDPNADSVDDALGVAIEKYVSIHKIVEGIESGIYKKVDITTASEDEDLEVTQDLKTYQDDKVKLITYYGLVPREYLTEGDEEEQEYEELFSEGTSADEHSNLVEAIIVIANDSILLKAEANPYMMKDRPVIAYQDDTVPGRFWGRGTAEKAYNMQKAIDGQLRAHMDSLALTTAPMIAMDATRLPRGAKFEIKPGKAILTNGSPSEILYPFKFGQTDGNATAAAQNFERMLLQATGTVDSAGMPSNVPRDAGAGGMSMAMAGIIKKYKRTLSNFQEDFMIPFINKAAFRYMQFDSERYPSVDMTFIPTATLGILAREFEQQQMIGLLQTLGPNTPVLPLILKGILQNSSLSNRGELMKALDEMSQPNPQAAEAQQAQQQAAMQLAQAQVADLQSKAQKQSAEAQKTMIEAQMIPEEQRVKLVQAASTNLDRGDDFEKRLKLADMMLKEKQVNLKAADIASNERIASLQMMNKSSRKA
jgi:hypothetical protein